MPSPKPSRPATAFDPAVIPCLSVIRVEVHYPDSSPKEKMLVVMFHADGYAVCMKATSKVAVYKNNHEKMAGAVLLAPGEVSCFPRETIIQVENLWPVAHADITVSSVRARLPETLRPRLIQ